MTALLGTQLEEDYIQVGSVRLPLPKSDPGRGESEEYDVLRTTPLEPFQASVVLGDDSLIADDRIAAAVFGDQTPGIGTRRYNEQESLAGIQDGDLLTVEGVTTLPPYRTAISQAGGALSASVYGNPTPTGFLFNWTQRYRFALYSPAGITQIYDSTLAAFGAPTGPPNGTPPMNAFARFAGYWVYCVNNAGVGTIWYSTDGKNYTAGWAPGGTTQFWGLQRHDGKLYVVTRDTATNEMSIRWISTQAQLTAGAGVAWPGVAALGIALEAAEVITNLAEWTDKNTGDKMIYVCTTRRIIGYNDADFWVDYWPIPDPNDSYRPFILFNPRDELLYCCFGGQNDSVFAFNHQQIDEVGPNKLTGISKGGNDAFTLRLLAANSRHMFAYGDGQQGRVLIANDAFGWSPFARAKLANPADLTSAANSAADKIAGMFYGGARLVLILGTGTVEYIDWPDQAASIYRFLTTGPPDSRAHAAGPFWNFYGWFDKGNELLWGLAKYWTIHVDRISGAFSLPANCQVLFKWQFDGGAWSAVTTLTQANVFPKRIKLPGPTSQAGVAFRKVRFAVGLRGDPGASFNYDTPIARAVTLAFTREPDIYDGLQVPVDLRDERWDNGRLMKFYGNDRQYLRDYLETLKSGPGVAKTHYEVTIGWQGKQKVYGSMDVRVSGVEDPQDRFGLYSLTLRDLTAPEDGA